LADISATYSPALLPPTNEIALICLSRHIYFVVSNPPFTTLTTPLGSPTSFSNLHKIVVAPGTLSDGFNTYVFPRVIAIGNIHIGIIAGKLNGAIPATTPNGALNEYVSIPLPTFYIVSPIDNEAIEQACSTTSKPLRTSPLASGRVFPCSKVKL
jgi:hypothetical protein